CTERTASLSEVAACVDDGVVALVDRLACRNYPNAAEDGIACPSGSPATTTSTTTIPSTTTTTTTPEPVGCCDLVVSACLWLSPADCASPLFNGTPGPAGSVCDSATGTCTTVPAMAGNCCTLTADGPPVSSICIASPLLDSDEHCLSVGQTIGPFTSASVI